jgi:hypothetical protein
MPVVDHLVDEVGGSVVVVNRGSKQELRLGLRRLSQNPLAVVFGELPVISGDRAAGDRYLLARGDGRSVLGTNARREANANDREKDRVSKLAAG